MDKKSSKPPLERFLESLTSGEKVLLEDYLKHESLETLVLNFDKLIGAKNEIKKINS
jgi:hypothetical protein